MTRNWNHIQNPVAEIIGHSIGRPIPKTKEGLNSTQLRLHNRSVRKRFQFFVARNVIAMSVSVGYDQRNAVPIVPGQPLINLARYGASNVSFTRARIKQQCLVLSEKQV